MPSILPQLIINGLIAGSIYALAASGLSLTYYVLKFLNFAQGAIITISAYLFFLFFNTLGLNYIFSGILSIFASIMIMLIIDLIVYKQLRKRKATNVVLMISSLALLIFFSSLILAVFGSSTKVIQIKHNMTFDFGIFTITVLQAVIVFSTAILFLVLWLVVKKTKLGKAMRALADNKDVAQVVGINPEKIYGYTFIIAGIIGAVAGILIGLEQNLYPQMGVPMIIKGFISAVVGGIGSVPGSIVGGLFIGLVENLGIWFLPSGYKDVISFTILFVFLLLRPKGIFGVKMRDDN